jgi:hypothetical protein
MNGIYQYNSKDSLACEGREISICANGIEYFYSLADGDTLSDAVESFAAAYSSADEGAVNVLATEYLNGFALTERECVIAPTGDPTGKVIH